MTCNVFTGTPTLLTSVHHGVRGTTLASHHRCVKDFFTFQTQHNPFRYHASLLCMPLTGMVSVADERITHRLLSDADQSDRMRTCVRPSRSSRGGSGLATGRHLADVRPRAAASFTLHVCFLAPPAAAGKHLLESGLCWSGEGGGAALPFVKRRMKVGDGLASRLSRSSPLSAAVTGRS